MSSALNYSLRLLKSRLRSAWEIDQVLLRRGVEEDERTAVLHQLTEADLINDERFAIAWIHTRDRLAPRGEYLLRMELVKKGIAKSVIDKTLRERRQAVADEDSEQKNEEDLARDLIERKTRVYAHLAPEVRERRLISLLMRRGFSYETARRILKA